MNATRPPGRPGKSDVGLSRSVVVLKALDLLDADGERGLTMRALAKSMSVTPMALYHHVGNRDELIAALVEHVFGKVVSTMSDDLSPTARIEALLSAYCQHATDHPELILAVFRDPGAFAATLKELTADLWSTLQMMGLPAPDVDRWLGLLVDYTHGYALSEAAAQNKTSGGNHQQAYEQNIRFLTAMVAREVGA